MMPKFQYNQKVRLPAFEDQPEETGTVEEYEGNGMYIVIVSPRRDTCEDDGIREVHEENMEAM
jgi:hypothetical protein